MFVGDGCAIVLLLVDYIWVVLGIFDEVSAQRGGTGNLVDGDYERIERLWSGTVLGMQPTVSLLGWGN